eukprot:4719458-Prymnesium_polylepis.1
MAGCSSARPNSSGSLRSRRSDGSQRSSTNGSARGSDRFSSGKGSDRVHPEPINVPPPPYGGTWFRALGADALPETDRQAALQSQRGSSSETDGDPKEAFKWGRREEDWGFSERDDAGEVIAFRTAPAFLRDPPSVSIASPPTIHPLPTGPRRTSLGVGALRRSSTQTGLRRSSPHTGPRRCSMPLPSRPAAPARGDSALPSFRLFRRGALKEADEAVVRRIGTLSVANTVADQVAQTVIDQAHEAEERDHVGPEIWLPTPLVALLYHLSLLAAHVNVILFPALRGYGGPVTSTNFPLPHLLLWILDLVLWLDFACKFITPAWDDGVRIFDHRAVALAYLRGDFAYDLLTRLPWD